MTELVKIENWALYELCFPRSSYAGGSYGAGPMLQLIGMLFWNLLTIGLLGLVFYFRKRIRWKGMLFLLITTSFLLSSWFAVGAVDSKENKAKVQWYIDDLKSQGFEVTYYAQYPYNRGAVTIVYSYSNFTSLAKDLNCTYVLVYGGAPLYFMFFFPSDIRFLINQHGQYLFGTNWER